MKKLINLKKLSLIYVIFYGIRNHKDIYEKLNDENLKKKNNFIEFIKKEIDIKIKDIWYIKKSNQLEEENNEEEKNNNDNEVNYIEDKDIVDDEDKEFKILDEKEKKDNERKEEYKIKEKEENKIIYEEVNVKEKIKINKLGGEKENKRLNDNNNIINEEEESDGFEDDFGYIHNNEYNNTNEKILRIDPKLSDEIEVSELDGINTCINKIKLLNYYSQIYIKKNVGYVVPKSNDYINYDNLPIEQLYNESIYLSQYFMYRIINSLNKNNIDLNKKCVTILLDCSVYIPPNKKITNMLILCAMTMVLHNLKINYSIGLFGDEDFKVIIKQFEDEHSLFILQQVYECLMLKRYRTNLASVVWFAQKNVKFIGSHKYNFYNIHPEQII